MAFANSNSHKQQATPQAQTQEFDGQKWLDEAITKTERLNKVAAIAQKTVHETTAYGSLTQSVALARFVGEIRSLVLGLLPTVKPLMGTHLGFRTDRDSGESLQKYGPYRDDTIADCLTEAVIHDVRWTGNEMNIIAGRMYRTKEYYTRAVRELPGLTDLQLNPGVPKMFNGGSVVPYRATWLINGSPHSIERDIPVKVNGGMGADAVIGKATRKMLAAIHSRITGSTQSALDVNEEIDTTPQTAPIQPAAATPAPQPGKVDLRRTQPAAEAAPPPQTEATAAEASTNSPEREALLRRVDEAMQVFGINEPAYLLRFMSRRNGFKGAAAKVTEVSMADLAKIVALSDAEIAAAEGGEGELFPRDGMPPH